MQKVEFGYGFRFKPTDAELIEYHLKRKLKGKTTDPRFITGYDGYSIESDKLPNGNFKYGGGSEAYYFTKRNCKDSKGTRVDRRAGNGSWKATGLDKPIKNNKGEVVGLLMHLSYHRDQEKAASNWVMHEYRIAGDNPKEWVVCRIKKNALTEKRAKGENAQSADKVASKKVKRIHWSDFETGECSMSANNGTEKEEHMLPIPEPLQSESQSLFGNKEDKVHRSSSEVEKSTMPENIGTKEVESQSIVGNEVEMIHWSSSEIEKCMPENIETKEEAGHMPKLRLSPILAGDAVQIPNYSTAALISHPFITGSHLGLMSRDDLIMDTPEDILMDIDDFLKMMRGSFGQEPVALPSSDQSVEARRDDRPQPSSQNNNPLSRTDHLITTGMHSSIESEEGSSESEEDTYVTEHGKWKNFKEYAKDARANCFWLFD